MLTKGITSNKLVSDLYEGVTKSVPVGQTPLTNTFAKNSPDVYPVSVGQPMAILYLSDFEATGSENDSKTLVRDELTNSVSYAVTAEVNDEALLEAAFDENSGALHIVRANGSVLSISGFLRQVDFGVGSPGPVGNRGLDGSDGEDGFDGDDGDDGCSGVVGEMGEEGEEGDEGKDGPPGIPGPVGQNGLPGLRGPVGKPGRFGHEGSRGQKGLSCTEGSVGSSGQEGEVPVESVVVASTPPTGNTLVWGKL
jgi:hypothetical protein